MDRAFANEHEYAFSTTGHSLGAWLAEISLYFSEFNFDIRAKSVTFDSPGAIIVDSFKSNIRHPSTEHKVETLLDITTYVSAPNFVNTCNAHIGRVYRLYPNIKLPSPIKTVSNSVKLLFSLIGMQSRSDDIDSLLSIFGHALDPMIETFDPQTGKPVKYDVVIGWQKLIYAPSKTVGRNMLTELLGTADLAIDTTTLGAVIHLFEEAAKGRINQQQYLDYWRYASKQGSETGYHPIAPLNVEDEFYENYRGHHALEDVNLREDVFIPDGQTFRGVDYYLQQLKYCSDSQISQVCNNKLLAKQLSCLRESYSTRYDSSVKSRVVFIEKDSDKDLTIEQLKYWLYRLMTLDPTIEEFLKQDILAAQCSDRYLEETFAKTSTLLGSFVKAFTGYTLLGDEQRDLNVVLQSAEQFSKTEYIKGLKVAIDSGELRPDDLLNYLKCVCRASQYHQYKKHDGLTARIMLMEAKNLVEDYWVKVFKINDAKDLLQQNIITNDIYDTIHGSNRIPEIYAKIVYLLGRTYRYQDTNDIEMAKKYFAFSKDLGNRLKLFEGHLSDGRGFGVIEGDEILAHLKDNKLEEAAEKLKRAIDLYKLSKADTKSYTDYPLDDKSAKTIIPCNDLYARTECEEQLIKHYAYLVSITLNPTKRTEYVYELKSQLLDSSSPASSGLLVELERVTNNTAGDKPLSNKKKASVYNTIGNALLTLQDHNQKEFETLKNILIQKLHLKSKGDLEVMEEIFEIAISMPGTSKYFTTADAYNGCMLVAQKQGAPLSTIEEYKQKRDEVNKLLNRSSEHDGIIIPHLSITSQAATSDISSWWSCLWSHKSYDHDTNEQAIGCSGDHKPSQDDV